MTEDVQNQEIRVGKIDSRREEIDRAFAEMMEDERKRRLEQAMRLRKIKIVKH